MIERHFTLPVLLFRVLGFGKTAQYTDGLPQVTEATCGRAMSTVCFALLQAYNLFGD